MNPELEALLQAYDAFLQASREDAVRLETLYEARLDAFLERNPTVSRMRLHSLVKFQYRQWLAAQRKPPTLPPKA
jgi:hypothetical protein